jgi:hypothetical protein
VSGTGPELGPPGDVGRRTGDVGVGPAGSGRGSGPSGEEEGGLGRGSGRLGTGEAAAGAGLGLPAGLSPPLTAGRMLDGVSEKLLCGHICPAAMLLDLPKVRTRLAQVLAEPWRCAELVGGKGSMILVPAGVLKPMLDWQTKTFGGLQTEALQIFCFVDDVLRAGQGPGVTAPSQSQRFDAFKESLTKGIYLIIYCIPSPSPTSNTNNYDDCYYYNNNDVIIIILLLRLNIIIIIVVVVVVIIIITYIS